MYLRPTGLRQGVLSSHGFESGQERAPVIAAFDEAVNGVAVDADRRHTHFARAVAQGLGLADAARAAAGGGAPRGLGIVHPQRDIAHAIAVQPDMRGDFAIGLQRRGEHEADLVLHQDVAGAVAGAGLGTAIGGQPKAERGAIEVRRLARVADVKLDVIRAVERKEVLLNRRFLLQCLRHNSSSKLRYTSGCPRRFR